TIGARHFGHEARAAIGPSRGESDRGAQVTAAGRTDGVAQQDARGLEVTNPLGTAHRTEGEEQQPVSRRSPAELEAQQQPGATQAEQRGQRINRAHAARDRRDRSQKYAIDPHAGPTKQSQGHAENARPWGTARWPSSGIGGRCASFAAGRSRVVHDRWRLFDADPRSLRIGWWVLRISGGLLWIGQRILLTYGRGRSRAAAAAGERTAHENGQQPALHEHDGLRLRSSTAPRCCW